MDTRLDTEFTAVKIFATGTTKGQALNTGVNKSEGATSACSAKMPTFTAADALAAMADCQYDWSTTICARAEKKKMISNLRHGHGAHISAYSLLPRQCVVKHVVEARSTVGATGGATHWRPPLLKPVR